MKRVLALLVAAMMVLCLSSCAASSREAVAVPSSQDEAMGANALAVLNTQNETEEPFMAEKYTITTKISEVISDPVFGDYEQYSKL